MKNKKKHFITAILATLFLILVLYLIFHDSLGEIKTQLFQADKKALLILVIFGNLYVLLDGWVLHYMIVKNLEKCTFWQAIRLAYMVVFFNVTTFAAGTKPAQIYDLYQESQIKPGKSFGILTMEYVSHKLTIVLYAAVMLCFFSYGSFSGFGIGEKLSADRIRGQLCYTALSDHVLHQSEVCTVAASLQRSYQKRKNQRKGKSRNCTDGRFFQSRECGNQR